MKEKTLKPVNQKSLYATWSELYRKIMDGEVEDVRAINALAALSGMNRTMAIEVKRAEVTREPIRIVESKNFEETK